MGCKVSCGCEPASIVLSVQSLGLFLRHHIIVLYHVTFTLWPVWKTPCWIIGAQTFGVKGTSSYKECLKTRLLTWKMFLCNLCNIHVHIILLVISMQLILQSRWAAAEQFISCLLITPTLTFLTSHPLVSLHITGFGAGHTAGLTSGTALHKL